MTTRFGAGDQPLVSFLMPVYNGERYLELALSSARRQSYQPIEIVVVDDGSTDASPAILARTAVEDDRIVVQRQRKKGQAEALNNALSLARGAFVAVLDCDDVALADRLLHQVPVLVSRPEVAVVGGAVEYMSEQGATFATVAYPTDAAEVRRRLRLSSPLVHSAATVRRDVVVGLGGYRTAFALALDYDLWLRIAEQHEIVNVPETVARYRVQATQGSSNLEQIALETVVARASARARRAGKDPIDREPLQAERLPSGLAMGEAEVGREFVRYACWYGKALARAGDKAGASEVFARAEKRARALDDFALLREVAAASGRSRRSWWRLRRGLG